LIWISALDSGSFIYLDEGKVLSCVAAMLIGCQQAGLRCCNGGTRAAGELRAAALALWRLWPTTSRDKEKSLPAS